MKTAEQIAAEQAAAGQAQNQGQDAGQGSNSGSGSDDTRAEMEALGVHYGEDGNAIVDPELTDERGVPWKNVASELRRKSEDLANKTSAKIDTLVDELKKSKQAGTSETSEKKIASKANAILEDYKSRMIGFGYPDEFVDLQLNAMKHLISENLGGITSTLGNVAGEKQNRVMLLDEISKKPFYSAFVKKYRAEIEKELKKIPAVEDGVPLILTAQDIGLIVGGVLFEKFPEFASGQKEAMPGGSGNGFSFSGGGGAPRIGGISDAEAKEEAERMGIPFETEEDKNKVRTILSAKKKALAARKAATR